MASKQLLFHIRHLSLSSTKHVLDINSFQQRCLLHTSLPLMNKEKSSEKKDATQRGGSNEQPHMRVEAKAAAAEKRRYNYLSIAKKFEKH
jgi:hypothetical protein